MIAIIDYDAGNIKSVEKALVSLGQEVCVTRDRDVILSADKVILPGVGSFGDAMEKSGIQLLYQKTLAAALFPAVPELRQSFIGKVIKLVPG